MHKQRFAYGMDIKLIFAWNLRRLRVKAGISQDDLGFQAELERAYVGHLERGKRNPTIVTIDKLAKVLKCEFSEFFIALPEDATSQKPLKAGRKKGV
jgi:transcriptional regulator with XRE-family HTH domain